MIEIIKEWISDLTSLGSLPFYGFVLLFLMIIGEFTGFLVLFFSLATIYLITIPIRLLFYKERPENRKKKVIHRNFIERIDHASFPSIHSARIGAISSLGLFSGDLLLATFFAGTLIVVMASRVLLKKHDVLDVVSGAILGVVVGMLMISFF